MRSMLPLVQAQLCRVDQPAHIQARRRRQIEPRGDHQPHRAEHESSNRERRRRGLNDAQQQRSRGGAVFADGLQLIGERQQIGPEHHRERDQQNEHHQREEEAHHRHRGPHAQAVGRKPGHRRGRPVEAGGDERGVDERVHAPIGRRSAATPSAGATPISSVISASAADAAKDAEPMKRHVLAHEPQRRADAFTHWNLACLGHDATSRARLSR